MSNQIDRIGCYRGYVLDHGISASQNGFPQFTGRFSATQRWVDEADLMKHFGLEAPGWVDWTSYDQESVGYLTLFGRDKKKDDGSMKKLFHVDDLAKATGWSGARFAELAAMDISKTLITFWVDEDEYEGNVRLRVQSVGAGDADAVRALRVLDASALKDLDARFAGLLAPQQAAAPAKAPASAPKGAPLPPKPTAAPAPTVAPPAATPPAASTPAPSAAPSKGPPSKPPAKPVVTAPVEEAPFSFKDGVDGQLEAWDNFEGRIKALKLNPSDDKKAESWITASTEVNPEKNEDTFTGAEWGQIINKALALVQA